MVCTAATAQTNFGELRATVIDKETKEPLDFAQVTVKLSGAFIKTEATNEKGEATIKQLQPEMYDVQINLVGYQKKIIKEVPIKADEPTILKVEMLSVASTVTETVFGVFVESPIPQFELTHTFSNPTNSPFRNNLTAMLNQAPNTFSQDGQGIVVGGSRPGTNNYYWNGILLTGNNFSSFPAEAMQNTSILLGGFSAEYGDFLGGAISINTPRPGLNKIRKVEVISSSLFDKYHNNYAEAFFMGPLWVKNKGRGAEHGDRERVKLGYMLSTNFHYQADRLPSAIGAWQLKNDKQKELEANPIKQSPVGQGFVPAAEFVTQGDLERVSANQNVPSTNATFLGELNFTPNDRIQILLGAKYDYANRVNYNFGNSLFNSANNSQTIQHNLLSYVGLTHNLKTSKESKIKNAYYTIRLDYQSQWQKTQDPLHGEDFFNYGHIGKFNTYSTPAYEFVTGNENAKPDSVVIDGKPYYLKNYYRQTGNRLNDTLITFDRSNTSNPLRANYTDLFFELSGRNNVNSITDIRSSGAGLVNGQNPIGVYSNMWNNIGLGVQGYGKNQQEKFGFNATGQLSTENHDLRFGVYFEQQVQRGWNVNANSLWTLMWQLANNGLELDKENPILVTDANGIFNDTVKYGFKQSASQSTFDKNLRSKLIAQGAIDNNGKPINENSFVDVNSYNPNMFSLSMFSADELLNNGNNYVSYFGYDYLGNKVRGRNSIADFTDNEQFRSVGAYMPTYAAAFIQDKVEFKNFTVRAGLRLERFDNNLPVLKDPFLLYDAKTANEVKEINGNAISHPEAIKDDFVVYVDDAKNPTQVTGYRNGTTWYNDKGLQIVDAAVIAEKSKSSTIQPYLVNPEQNRVSASAFKDYKPQIMVLPRLYFDFPVNDYARFFGSYDALSQRPTNNFATISQYYYLPFNPTSIIGNPDLKPQLSFNYELGFKLKVSSKSALGLTAAYKEQRNLIQLFRYNNAYPISYTSFANIDFSTIKSFTVQYIYKHMKRFEFDASYVLQYADGTGSSAGSQQALVSAGQPNLRTLFPLSYDIRNNIKFNATYYTKAGDDYKGPKVRNVKVFQNMGIVVNLNAFSGIPFTPNQLPTPNAQSGIANRSPIKGTPFGARLPWQLQNDLSIFKNVTVKLGRTKEGKPKKGDLRFSLWVNNVLNIKNIRGIHPYTGSANTDGWLASEQGNRAKEDAVSSQAFVDLYNTALANPNFFTMPRRVRLGVSLSF